MTRYKEIEEAISAYRIGNLSEARVLAMRAILHNPNNEVGWIILAAVSPPERAIKFLQKALELNPENSISRRGLDWANRNLPEIPEKTTPVISQDIPPSNVKRFSWINLVFKRATSSILILLAISFLTLLLLHLANLGRLRISENFWVSLQTVGNQFGRFLFQHPESYTWKKEVYPAWKLVSQLFLNSAGLLLVSLMIASIVGGVLGLISAQIKKRNLATPMVFIAVLGISLPSFLFAMLFWILDIRLFRWLGLSSAPFPPTGFGWDLHLVMPAIVLAARPTAQIMQITYIHAVNILSEDFIRTARAKGLHQSGIIRIHVLRNILIAYLTTIGNSLRFSLASLPVVESFFLWPGIGLSILEAINLGNVSLVTDLTMLLGLFFLLINNGLDILYPIIDPRIRSLSLELNLETTKKQPFWRTLTSSLKTTLADLTASLRLLLRISKPVLESRNISTPRLATTKSQDPIIYKSDTRRVLTNVPFMFGSLLVLGLLALILFGPGMIAANPYQTNGIMMIEGIIHSPPFEPSTVFPWGSDLVGRDIQALVLYGARQTIILALLATIARVLFGALLGISSGWWVNSWFDRFVKAVSAIWGAFPETIFALLLILALGIQKGRSVFIIALCLIGWSEITQFVRSLVINLKPSLFIEAARSIGSHSRQLLWRHVLPHLIPSLLVLFALQMGGILLLLAELGFLNIFLGGGFKVTIAEGANMMPIVYYFSDIPEWGSLLANIRDWWRSYPWLAWYPGLFFFISIFTFNIWGEGIRRVVQETHINLNRLINRYTVSAVVIATLVINGLLNATSPLDMYAKQAHFYETENAMTIANELSSSRFQGRRSDQILGHETAQYIAEQMEAIGLYPGASNTEFLQQYMQSFPVLESTPILQFRSKELQSDWGDLVYKRDFSELGIFPPGIGTNSRQVVGVVLGAGSEYYLQKSFSDNDKYLTDKIALVRYKDINRISFNDISGLLVIAETEEQVAKKYLFPNFNSRYIPYPILIISPQLGEKLLASTGSSLADMESMENHTPVDQLGTTAPGTEVLMSVIMRESDSNVQFNVMGYIPGSASEQAGSSNVRSDDQNVIVVSAYYDGLGRSPEGMFYPGANDNASGVATMLEIARLLKNSPYPPDKTVLFVAWAPGERQRGMSISNITEASRIFSNLKVDTVLEVSGVGGGKGDAIALDSGSSFRLVTLFQKVASKFDTKITTRGRNPHTGLRTIAGFGERTALSAYISWDGSDQFAHLPTDTFENLDPLAMEISGKTIFTVLSIVSRENDY